MIETLSPIEIRILQGAAGDVAELKRGRLPAGWSGRRSYLGVKQATELARANTVRLAISRWLGGVDRADRSAISRAYARLAKLSLVELVGAERCTHLKVTKQGARVAKELQQVIGLAK